MPTRTPRSKNAGFTLIELIVVIVVLAFGGVTLSYALRYALERSADPLIVKQAIAIGQAMMEEVMSKSYDPVNGSPTAWTSPRSATQWNDILDYNGFTTTGVYTANGDAIPSLSSYSVAVAVSSGTLVGIPSTAQARIQVTVTGRSRLGGTGASPTSIVLEGYRVAY
jgi:MSHA pilin protein MshD